jgi:glycosyl hydrolase family 20
MDLDYLVPHPQKIKVLKSTFPRPKRVKVVAPKTCATVAASLKKDLRELAGLTVSQKVGFAITLRLKPGAAKAEGYRLSLGPAGAEIVASDEPGLFYGVQTLLQIFVLHTGDELPRVTIADWPHYRTRSFMVDLGRAPYSLALLKRTVRILALLKMNMLHVHLNDDALNGLRFKALPLGSENPGAITVKEFGELVRYARKSHVTVMPEIECWGHAASFIYHYPELYGGAGMWGGMSFGMGEETFEFFAAVFDELVPVLEKECPVHVGLDEALWTVLPTVPESERDNYSPSGLVDRLYKILQRAGRKHGKKITMHLWADHAGRPLPKAIEKKVVIEPWMYFEYRADDIRKRVEKYGGRGKTPFMMGAGMSSVHFGGHFGATRAWCQLAKDQPNAEGVTICLWECNDLAGRLVGLYGGADHAWTPDTPAPIDGDTVHERLLMDTHLRMRKWQTAFKDADTDAINADRGPEVFRGRYCWGAQAGQPAAPTVDFQLSPDNHKGAALG